MRSQNWELGELKTSNKTTTFKELKKKLSQKKLEEESKLKQHRICCQKKRRWFTKTNVYRLTWTFTHKFSEGNYGQKWGEKTFLSFWGNSRLAFFSISHSFGNGKNVFVSEFFPLLFDIYYLLRNTHFSSTSSVTTPKITHRDILTYFK